MCKDWSLVDFKVREGFVGCWPWVSQIILSWSFDAKISIDRLLAKVPCFLMRQTQLLGQLMPFPGSQHWRLGVFRNRDGLAISQHTRFWSTEDVLRTSKYQSQASHRVIEVYTLKIFEHISKVSILAEDLPTFFWIRQPHFCPPSARIESWKSPSVFLSSLLVRVRRGENSVDAACTARYKYHRLNIRLMLELQVLCRNGRQATKITSGVEKTRLGKLWLLLVRLEQCWYVQRKSLRSGSPSSWCYKC